MRAMVLTDFGGPEVLQATEVELPEVGPGEARVSVAATAVLRTRDVTTRAGKHPFSKLIQPPHILGGEFAGTVDALSPEYEGMLQLGQRVAVSSVITCGTCDYCRSGRDEACPQLGVLGIHHTGSYADFAVAPVGNLHPIPDDLGFADAAVLAATGPVARAQLDAAGVGEGSWVAIPGAGGALGSMIAALALSRGAKVIALEQPGVGEVELTRTLGVTHLLTTDADDLAAALLDVTDGHGLDAVVDNLGIPPLWDACMKALAPFGIVVMSGTVGGPLTFDPAPLYLRCYKIVGVRTGNAAQTRAFWQDVAAGFRLPPELITTFALADVAEAHRRLEGGAKVGHFALLGQDEGR